MSCVCIGDPIPGSEQTRYGWQYTDLAEASNGKLYSPPFNADQTLEIDPIAGEACTIGEKIHSSGKYLVAEIASNGRIYSPPCSAMRTLEIDPATGCTTLIGDEIPDIPNDRDNMKYRTIVLAKNGKLYAPPYSAGKVLEIDPETRTACTIGDDLPGGIGKYIAAALAVNGKIYAVPACADQVLEIDPSERSVSLIGMSLWDEYAPRNSSWKKYGVVIASSCGRLYAPPCYAKEVLEIDPVTRSVNLIGGDELFTLQEHWNYNEKYWCIAMAGNGCLYCPPCDATRVLEIDPVKRTAQFIGEAFSTALGKYWTAAALPAGRCVYAAPYDSGQVLEIDTIEKSINFIGPDFKEQRKSAKYQTLLACGEYLYAPPAGRSQVLEIDPTAREVRCLAEDLWEEGDRWKKFTVATKAVSNGRLYAPPHQKGQRVLEITPSRKRLRLDLEGAEPSILDEKADLSV